MILARRHYDTLFPTTQAYNITFSTLANADLRVVATKGSAVSRIIVCCQGPAVSGVPSGIYTANRDFLFAPDIDGNGLGLARVVYAGTDRRVDIANLTPGTQYTVKVFEYDSNGYNLENAANNPRSYTTVAASPTNLFVTDITSSGFTMNWSAPPGGFDGYEITLGRASDFSIFVSGWNPKSFPDSSLISATFSTGLANTTYYWRIRSTLGSARSAWHTAATSVTTLPS